MNPTLWITYLVLAGAAVAQALLLLLQTWENRRYSRSCMRDLSRHRPSGRAVILAPCKGSEPALRQNLRALFQQDYPDYEITFIVQQANDPACAVIGRLMAEHPGVTARLLVAGRASHCGQKVHNLRAGAAALGPQVRYLVFVDSDARPRPEWLRAAIAELDRRPDLGATSGYRWFMPSRPSLAHHVLYSINCNLISLLSSRNHYMVWGGSWAIRRDTFEATGLREAWKGTLSDDLVAAGVLRHARRQVRFEPACMVASPLDLSAAKAIEFLRRQYMVARHYSSWWWLAAVLSATFRNAVWLGSLCAIGCGLVLDWPPPWVPAGLLGTLYALAACRAWLIQDLAGVYFPDRLSSLRAARRFAIWAGPLAGMVEWLVLLGTVLGRHVVWRGIRYRFLPGGRMKIVGRGDRAGETASVHSRVPRPHARKRHSLSNRGDKPHGSQP